MKSLTKVLLAVTVLGSVSACAVVPAPMVVGHPRGVVTVGPPVIVAPAPILIRPGWGWGGRWHGGYHRHHHY